tara:strand:+ start:4099 stop:4305 length:207 start_codon:yes stop_codon:yes gene_type:complete
MDNRIKASCTVDDLGNMQYEVNVWGENPFDHERAYTLKATSDNLAAQEGIRLFVEEMECLRNAVMKDE